MHYNEHNHGSLGPEVQKASKATFLSSVINVTLFEFERKLSLLNLLLVILLAFFAIKQVYIVHRKIQPSERY